MAWPANTKFVRDSHEYFRRHWQRALGIREKFRFSEEAFHLVLAGGVGVLGGLVNLFSFYAIEFSKLFFLRKPGDPVEVAIDMLYWQRLVTPTLGGLVAGLVLYFGLRLAGPQRSSNILEVVVAGDGRLPFRTALVKFFSSLVTIGSGGSIGREGGITQLTATFASKWGVLAKWPPYRLRLLVGCGAASGIAAAYNAPISGAVFAAIIVLGNFSMSLFAPLVFSSVVATMVSRSFFGLEPWYSVPPFNFTRLSQLPWFIFLGLLAGVVGALFLKLLIRAEELFKKVRAPIYIRLATGGLAVGLLALAYPEVWGNGYVITNRILRGQYGSIAFSAEDIVAPEKLAAKLRTPPLGDLAAVYVSERISERSRKLLEHYPGGVDLELQKSLAEDLNSLIRDQPLYQPELFPEERLSERTRALVGSTPKGLETATLNRLLLLDSFREELSQADRGETLPRSLLFLLGLFVAKLLATCATVGSGAVGGVFTPTLFLGAGLGALFGLVLQLIGAGTGLPVQPFAVVGMGSMLAATTHSPLLAMIMVFEISLDYSLMPPMMLACVVSILVARRLHKDSIYTEPLRRKGLLISQEANTSEAATQKTVADIMRAPVAPIRETASITEVADRFLTGTNNFVPVVDSRNQLLGVVALQDLKEFLRGGEELRGVIAYDIMRPPPPCVTPNQRLTDVLAVVMGSELRNIPVVNTLKEYRLIGALGRSEVLAIFSEAIAISSKGDVAA